MTWGILFHKAQPCPTSSAQSVQKTVVYYNASSLQMSLQQLILQHRFKDLKDPNDWLYSFNPCYTYSQEDCKNVYVSDSGATIVGAYSYHILQL